MLRLRVFGETSPTGEGAAGGLCAMIMGSGWASQAAIRSYSGTFGFLTRRFGALCDAGASALPAASLDTAGGLLGGTTIASAKGAVSAVGEAEIRRDFEGFAVF